MWHAMSMKEAVKQWESQNRQKISQAVEIKLTGICPALDKMDTIMLSFISCEKLSLSSNCIERITNLSSMKNLKILSLGRNNIKSISGIEAVADTLEELWLSYNQIEKLKGIGVMKKLRVLTMSNNNVREWVEFQRLAEVPTLKELVFVGNPLEERCSSEGIWRTEAVKRLPGLAKLDGQQCVEAEVNLSDTQTELQKTKGDEEDKNESKFADIEDEEANEHQEEVEGFHQEDPSNQEQLAEEGPNVPPTSDPVDPPVEQVEPAENKE